MATYEMLWDCSSCGTQKLLGKSHRRCPQCGAPQDPSRRYFPPAGQEVAVEGHVYVGVDWHCGACETPNSRAASFCVNCGNPREGNAEVKRVLDAPTSTASTKASTSSSSQKRWPLVAAGIGVLLLVVVVVCVVWKKDVSVVVDQHTWERAIDVERFEPRSESSWCDGMPGDAYSVSRTREQRSTRQIPDGQTCTTSRHDNGDGTFSTKENCSTKYRSEPVYDDKCYYRVDRWGVSRTAMSNGTLSTARAWPALHLGRSGQCLGCEREGARRETLTLELHDVSRPVARYSCKVDERRWTAFHDGERRTMKVRVVTGGAVCDTLQ